MRISDWSSDVCSSDLVAFSSLPLDLAIKQVKGDGSRKIAVFEDPNCGYCKRLHQALQNVDNITVYTLLFPILSPDSTVKARNIWCARSEEHTSELQSLMRISYAVFCLKKKTKQISIQVKQLHNHRLTIQPLLTTQTEQQM